MRQRYLRYPKKTAGPQKPMEKMEGFDMPRNTTLPETNIAPENGWLEYYFPIGEAYFQGLR